jgi:hypothetical protein
LSTEERKPGKGVVAVTRVRIPLGSHRYAEKTVNDPKNPNGYAFAIAHTNSYQLRLAYENLRGVGDVKVKAVRTVAERALRDEIGLLRHLNAAHLDELSSEKVDALTKTIVSEFHERQKKTD